MNFFITSIVFIELRKIKHTDHKKNVTAQINRSIFFLDKYVVFLGVIQKKMWKCPEFVKY